MSTFESLEGATRSLKNLGINVGDRVPVLCLIEVDEECDISVTPCLEQAEASWICGEDELLEAVEEAFVGANSKLYLQRKRAQLTAQVKELDERINKIKEEELRNEYR